MKYKNMVSIFSSELWESRKKSLYGSGRVCIKRIYKKCFRIDGIYTWLAEPRFRKIFSKRFIQSLSLQGSFAFLSMKKFSATFWMAQRIKSHLWIIFTNQKFWNVMVKISTAVKKAVLINDEIAVVELMN